MKLKSIQFLLLFVLFFGLAKEGVGQNAAISPGNIVACNTTIYDRGGVNGNYANSTNEWITIAGKPGQTITISGSYATEKNYDYIYLRDGYGNGGTVLGTYTNSGTLNYTGTAGQTLTVQLTSDGSTVASGFAFTVTYSNAPACPTTYNVSGSGGQSTTCGDSYVLKDHNGDNTSYGNNRNDYIYLNNNAGSTATLNISGYYTTESSYDFLRVYDGSTLVYGPLSGSGVFNFTGSAGVTYTLQFTSDGLTVAGGYALYASYTGSCIVCTAPTALTYGGSNSFTFCQDVSSTTTSPSFTGTQTNAAYTVSAGSLPAGMSINSSTGVISGTPSATGTFNPTIQVANSCGNTTKQLTITVNAAPSVSAGSNQTIGRGVAAQLAGTASAGSNSITWTSDIAGTFSNSNSLTSTWIPSNALWTGTATLTLTVVYPCGTVTKTVQITVETYGICPGANTGKVTFPAAPGGSTDTYQVSIDNGSTWSAYTNGAAINTDGATGSVKVRVKRTTSGCPSPWVEYTIWRVRTDCCNQPTITTTAISNIACTTASTGGNVTAALTDPCIISERGVVYATTANPTTANSKVTASGTTGAYTSSLSGLANGTTYYVRAYVTTSSGTVYGNDISFTTLAAPTNLNYANNAPEYCTGTAVSNSASFSGAPATSFSISPALPSGLNINTSNGTIWGTPSGTSSQNHTVTVDNACGSTTKTISITVRQKPTNLSYSSNTVSYCTNVQIANNTPSFTGSPATSYSILPALSAGLNFNTITGVISGMPTAAQAATNYTVTVTNQCGSTTKAVNITVNATPTITGVTGNSRCGTGTVALSATASSGTINWYAASSGGSSLGTGTSYTTPSISATTTYYVSASNGTCTSTPRTAVTATINTIPGTPAVGAITQPTCQSATGSVALSGLPTSAWTVTASPGGATLTGSSATATFSGLASGTYTFKVKINSTNCESAASGNAVINAGPTPPGTPTPVATYNCSNGTVSLSAGTLGQNEQARWYTAASGGSPVSTNNPFSPTLTNTTNYYVTIYNTVSLCESSPRKPIVAYKKGLDAYNITRATGNTYSDISGGTAVSSWRNGSSNGNLSNNINIGFTFPYDGANLSQFRVSTNGFITFNNASNASGDDLPACGNGDAYSGDNPIFSLAGREGTGQAIAPFYDDLIPNGYSLNSSIHYQLSGSAPNRVLTVQWRGMSKPVSSNCSSPCYYGNYNFQVKLYETSGNIEFVYGTMSTGINENSKSYSCGLNSASLTASPDITQLLAQQTANTNTFSASPKNNHSAVPATNSKIAFARNVAEAAIAVPQCVNYNYPANNATAQCVNSILSWSPVDGAPTAYDVYFGTAANPPLKQSDVTATYYNPGALATNTIYYWKIVPKNGVGAGTAGPIYKFTTGAGDGVTSISSSAGNTFCKGTTTTLTVNGTLSEGSSYQWSSPFLFDLGCTVSVPYPLFDHINNIDACKASSRTITYNSAGTYIYYVRTKGCNSNSSCAKITITVNDVPDQPGNFTTSSPTVCAGQTGVVYTVPTVSGATSYTWSYSGTGATIIGTSNSVTINFAANATGGTLSVKANGDCGSGSARTLAITVNTPSTAASSASASPAAICSGGNTTLSVTGGSLGTGANWKWYSGSCGGTLVGTGASVSVSPTVNTTYFVRAEGTCGNTVCVNTTVTINSSSVAPTTATATPSAICSGGSATLSSSNGTLGTGAVQVWYQGGCGDDAFDEGWNSQPYPKANTTVNSTSNGILNVTSTSGDPMINMYSLGSFDPNTYKYINVRYRVISGAPGQMEIFFTNSTYSAANANQRVGSTNLVTGGAWQTMAIDMSTHSLWTSSNVTGWRFDWSTGNNVNMEIDFIALSQYPIIGEGTSVSVSPTATTTYATKIKGVCNNTTCATTTVTVNPQPTATATVNRAEICRGGNSTITATVSGGTGNVTYQWEYSANGTSGWASVTNGTPGGFTYTNATTAAMTATTANGATTPVGNRYYRLVITYDGAGCNVGYSDVKSFNVVADPKITNAAASYSFCVGEVANIVSSSSNGTGSMSYRWQYNPGTFADVVDGTPAGVTYSYSQSTATNNTLSITGLTEGTYSYRFRQSVNTLGCAVNGTAISVVINPNNTAGVASSSPAVCINSAIPNITHTTTGATGIGAATGLPAGVTAAWASNKITISGTPTASGTFNYSIPLTGGCGTVSATGTITVNANPTASISGVTSFCSGGSTTLTASGGGTYKWDDNSTNATRTVSAAGTYSVTVTNASGCTAVASQAVTVNANPTASISGVTSFCTGGSTTLTASGGGTYKWDDNSTNAARTVSAAGTYSVTVTNASGCTAVASKAVTVNPIPTAPTAGTHVSAQTQVEWKWSGGGDKYKWSATNDYNTATDMGTSTSHTETGMTCGTSYTRYVWSYNSATACYSSATTLTATTASCCTAASITTQPVSPAASCAGLGAITLSVATTGDVTNYEWRKNGIAVSNGGVVSGQGTNTLTLTNPIVADAGNYTVVITTCNGATVASNAATVTIDPTSIGGTASSNQTICSGGTPSALSLSGNVGSIQWQSSVDTSTWNDMSGETSTSLVLGSLSSTTYYRAKVTSGVCAADNSSTVTITVNPTSAGGTASSNHEICSGEKPNNITLSSYTGNIQWQQSLTGNSNWSNVSGASASTLTSNEMGIQTNENQYQTLTVYYRAEVTSGSGTCPSAYSNVVEVSVNPIPILSSPSMLNCASTIPHNGVDEWNYLYFSASGGIPSYTISDITQGNTSEVVYTGNQGVEKIFRVKINDGLHDFVVEDGKGCKSVSTSYQTIANLPTNLPDITPGGTTITTSQCYSIKFDDWVHFKDPNDPMKVIASVNDNGVDLGMVTVTSYLEEHAAEIISTGAACAGTPQAAMRRHFVIKSQRYPDPETKFEDENQNPTNVNVRLYFTQADFNDLSTASTANNTQGGACATDDDITDMQDLYLTKYSGSDEDEYYTNNAPNGIYKVFRAGSGLAINGSGFDAVFGTQSSAIAYAELGVEEFSELWLHGGTDDRALPVEMLYIVAKNINNQYIRVDWATATEINNWKFEVERSTDGIHFAKIGEVEGHGTSTDKHEYSYSDKEVVPGIRYYYRLKQIDFDEAFEYSPTVSEMLKGDDYFNVSDFVPNPTLNTAKLFISTGKEQEVQIELHSYIGEIVKQGSSYLRQGSNTIDFEFNHLAAGTYTARILAGGNVYVRRVVVAR